MLSLSIPLEIFESRRHHLQFSPRLLKCRSEAPCCPSPQPATTIRFPKCYQTLPETAISRMWFVTLRVAKAPWYKPLGKMSWFIYFCNFDVFSTGENNFTPYFVQFNGGHWQPQRLHHLYYSNRPISCVARP